VRRKWSRAAVGELKFGRSVVRPIRCVQSGEGRVFGWWKLEEIQPGVSEPFGSPEGCRMKFGKPCGRTQFLPSFARAHRRKAGSGSGDPGKTGGQCAM